MKKNVGLADCIIRTIIAVVAIFLNYTMIITGTTGTLMVIASVVLLLTSLSDFCPIYAIFGISSRQQKAANQEADLRPAGDKRPYNFSS